MMTGGKPSSSGGRFSYGHSSQNGLSVLSASTWADEPMITVGQP